jgi:dihydroneopterin triphosphate diphosphatase
VLGAVRGDRRGQTIDAIGAGQEALDSGRGIGLRAMARRRRAPFQVLVYPYRRRPDAELEIALFRRVDGGYWQGIAGGGDEGETPEDAARREAREEAGIEPAGPWIALKPVLSVPVNVIRPDLRRHWPGWLTTIPCHPFAVESPQGSIRLSAEHAEFRWVGRDQARELVHWDTDRMALAALDVALSVHP